MVQGSYNVLLAVLTEAVVPTIASARVPPPEAVAALRAELVAREVHIQMDLLSLMPLLKWVMRHTLLCPFELSSSFAGSARRSPLLDSPSKARPSRESSRSIKLFLTGCERPGLPSVFKDSRTMYAATSRIGSRRTVAKAGDSLAHSSTCETTKPLRELGCPSKPLNTASTLPCPPKLLCLSSTSSWFEVFRGFPADERRMICRLPSMSTTVRFFNQFIFILLTFIGCSGSHEYVHPRPAALPRYPS